MLPTGARISAVVTIATPLRRSSSSAARTPSTLMPRLASSITRTVTPGSMASASRRAELDAVVGGEPANIQLRDAVPPQFRIETGGALGVIVAEYRIAVGLPVLALALYEMDAAAVERGMKLGVARALHAVIGPHDLRLAAQGAHLEGLFARVLRGEAAVIRRVPVLGSDDQVIAALGDQPVDHRHHLVAAGYRQVAAGAEAVLNVDDEQGAFFRRRHVRRCAGGRAASRRR